MTTAAILNVKPRCCVAVGRKDGGVELALGVRTWLVGKFGVSGLEHGPGSHPIDSGSRIPLSLSARQRKSRHLAKTQYRSRVVAQSQCQAIWAFRMCGVLHPFYSIEMLQQPGQMTLNTLLMLPVPQLEVSFALPLNAAPKSHTAKARAIASTRHSKTTPCR